MKFNGGAIIIKELQIINSFIYKFEPSRAKIWFKFDAFSGFRDSKEIETKKR